MDEGTFTIYEAEVVEETDRSVKINSPDFDEEFWVPKSAIHDDSEVFDGSLDGSGPGNLIVTYKWAERKGLI